MTPENSLDGFRKLATIRRIGSIDPIPGADAIEVATVTNWKVVVKKGEFQPGDLATYCEIDSFLPVRAEFEFLRKSSYRKLVDGREGFRLKTIRLRGQVSQGLLLPAVPGRAEGDDVTEELGIVKWEPPVPVSLTGVVRGPWPSVPKTDEERVQNLADILQSSAGALHYATEKLDGTSMTVMLQRDQFLVCSRNLNLVENSENTLWQVARRHNLEEGLRAQGGGLAIQGELIGPSIQGNRYKLQTVELRVFSAYDSNSGDYLDWDRTEAVAAALGLKTVPVLRRNVALNQLFASVEEILRDADGESAIGGGIREGVVWRAEGGGAKASFKAISNAFLLGEA